MAQAEPFEAFLTRNIDKELLRFIACGSVDDGKSTLLGRLLHDSSKIYEDQLASVRADSRRYGTTGEEPDLALLLDGLQAEREQGITIDVAYRYFSTDKRKFIVADAPGHEQYTRNMATGASTADLAVILVDARNGVQRQTRRHSYIVSALGIRSVVVAINKMDLVGFDEGVFERIRSDYATLCEDLGFEQVVYIPLSALLGDNVVRESAKMPWHSGPPLLRYLEEVAIPEPANHASLRLPIQIVSRPHQDFRGYCGTIAAGSLASGQAVKILPIGLTTKIERLFDGSGEISSASVGEAVTVTLSDHLDAGRGCVIVEPGSDMLVTDTATARVVWMSERPLRPGDLYDFKVGAQLCQGSVEAIVSEIDMDRNVHAQTDELELNDIGIVKLQFQSKVLIDPYMHCKSTGAFIMIDRLANMTAGAGMIMADGERPAHADRPDVFWHRQSVTKETRAGAKKQKPCIVWFTGLSGAGKSTIANALEKRLFSLGYHTYLLDGDNVRYGLNKDLGFSPGDRTENIRRVGEVAKLMVDAGLIVLCAFVSPYRRDRDAIRASVEKGEFVEVYVSTPIEVCEKRDTKGLYRKAREGEVVEFTGVSSVYERPPIPEVKIDASILTVEDCVSHVEESIIPTRF